MYRQIPDRIPIPSFLFVAWLTLGGVAGCAEQDTSRSPTPGDTPTAAARPVEVIDDAGRTVRLERPAQRVVSLVPAVTETILALGGGARLVARTDYDEDPRVAHLPSIGGGLTPSLELIASLQPDLVIAWEEAGVARIRPRLESLAIPVYADQTRDTAGIYSAVERLGHLLALDASADSLTGAIRRELDRVRISVDGRERPSVVYLIGLDPPMAAGPNLYIGEMIQVAGGANAFDDLTAPSPQISLEEIVRRRPDVVLIPTGEDSAEVVARLRSAPGWNALLASGATRVQTLPVDILHRPGPAIVAGARSLRDAIHPAAGGR